jgi:Ca-activated chloride channel homolog
MIRYLFILCFSLSALSTLAQKENKHIREGNKQYNDGKFEEAQTSYLRAIEENAKSFPGAFNLGNSLYKQEKYEEAASQFQMLTQTAQDKEIKAKAFHNLGNSYLKSQKYQEAVEAYKHALRNNPADEDARYNLAYAMQQLKQQQEQQQQDQKQDKKEEEKKEEQKDQKQDKKEDQKQEQQQQQKPKDELTKEEAQRLLEAMEREDKNVQDKLKKEKKAVKVQIEKDW